MRKSNPGIHAEQQDRRPDQRGRSDGARHQRGPSTGSEQCEWYQECHLRLRNEACEQHSGEDRASLQCHKTTAQQDSRPGAVLAGQKIHQHHGYCDGIEYHVGERTSARPRGANQEHEGDAAAGQPGNETSDIGQQAPGKRHQYGDRWVAVIMQHNGSTDCRGLKMVEPREVVHIGYVTLQAEPGRAPEIDEVGAWCHQVVSPSGPAPRVPGEECQRDGQPGPTIDAQPDHPVMVTTIHA